MKRISLLLLFLALITTAGMSQRLKGFGASFEMGYSNVSGASSSLRAMAPTKVSGITNNFFLMGAGAYYRSGRFVVGLNGNIGLQETDRSSSLLIEPLTIYAHARAGYIIFANKSYWLYPTVGLGRSWLGLQTFERDGKGDADEIGSQYFSRRSLELAVNADFPLVTATENSKMLSIIFGLSAGYRTSYGQGAWDSPSRDPFISIPSQKLEGWFIAASIGFGSFRNF